MPAITQAQYDVALEEVEFVTNENNSLRLKLDVAEQVASSLADRLLDANDTNTDQYEWSELVRRVRENKLSCLSAIALIASAWIWNVGSVSTPFGKYAFWALFDVVVLPGCWLFVKWARIQFHEAGISQLLLKSGLWPSPLGC